MNDNLWRRREQARGMGIGHSRFRFPQPKRPAAGTLSRRLQYPSKNRVDFSGFARTSVESADAGNCRRLNALAPEVARHQQVDDRATFAFDSRRLHQPSLTLQAKAARRSLRRRRADSVRYELRLASQLSHRLTPTPRFSRRLHYFSNLRSLVQTKVAHRSLRRRWAGSVTLRATAGKPRPRASFRSPSPTFLASSVKND